LSQFIFVRHGESEANAQAALADADSPLTELGKDQAHQTVDKIRESNITLIVCSPFLRAQQTAQIIAEELGIDSHQTKTLDDLHERRFGDLENKPREHESTWYYTTDVPEAESRQAVLDRSVSALQQIKELAQHDTVLVVGHACAGFYLLQVAAGHTTLESFDPPSQIDNAGYAIVEIQS